VDLDRTIRTLVGCVNQARYCSSVDQAPLTVLIGQAVKQARGEKGWSARRLAEEMTNVGVPWERVIVTKLENGRRRFVTAEELLSLAYVLDLKPAELLLGGRPEQFPVTPAVMAPIRLAAEWLGVWGGTSANFYGLGLRQWLALEERGREAARERWSTEIERRRREDEERREREHTEGALRSVLREMPAKVRTEIEPHLTELAARLTQAIDTPTYRDREGNPMPEPSDQAD
jgi:transcriptional regulator with XRE-family HTH domain